METGGQERDHSNVSNAYHTHQCQCGKEDDMISVTIQLLSHVSGQVGQRTKKLWNAKDVPSFRITNVVNKVEM